MTTQLLLKLLSAFEDVKQTQKLHSSMLQSIMKQLQAPSRSVDGTMPENVKFPLATCEDVDALEQHLQDAATKTVLVRTFCLFVFFFN